MFKFALTYKAHNVNSKKLLQHIVSNVGEMSEEFIVQHHSKILNTYDFSMLVEYLDLFIAQMVDDKQIVSFDVVGDFRNNDVDDVRSGRIHIDLEFQQYNCLNTTKILFEINKI